MPKFLWQVSYTAQGAKGLQQEGGSARRAAVQRATEQVGGKLEAFYFALGESDVYLIADLPDAGAAVALSVAVNGSGAAQVRTAMLLSPDEMDAALKKAVDYRAPGAAGR
ncbi:MAG TPA: GYD domain-containing protein [Vicinamibacterales bacterium]|nr:GYD domain-containing protein [Vicinamibacterales bacterium]